jgi:lactate dehydrogenase-like 2-hydroxyacid dehydrogenase
MRKKVLAPSLVPVVGKEQPDASILNNLLNRLKKIADVEVQPTSQQEWVDMIKNLNIIAGPFRVENVFNDNLLRNAGKLEMIQTFSIGYDYIDVSSCTKRGIIVCNVAEVYSEAVAQHVWAMILDLSKNLSKADRSMRTGKWHGAEGHMGIQLWGKTLGIVGLGAIGGRVAMKGRLAFGMKVLTYDPYVLPARAQLYGAELVSLERLLKESDVVSISIPLTPETRHIIGEKQLSLMKKSALIVSISRGAIDDKALIECLQKGSIRGAGLDAFDQEPLAPDNPLLKMENVVLTPEIASATAESVKETYESGVANVIRYIKGEKPYWMINPEAYELARSKEKL